jgi:hypothetical protein
MGNLINRYGLEAATSGLHDPYGNLEKPQGFQKVRRLVSDDAENLAPGPIPTVKSTVDELREKIGEIPSKKVKGRPKVSGSINSERPWEAEGISRMTWYRRQKSKGGE